MKKNNNHTEYIIFNGSKFILEWYFNSKGCSDALEYFDSLNDEEQIKTLGLFELMGNVGEIKNKTKFNFEGDKIFAFKPQPHRFLCFFFSGAKIIVTNAFHKKTDKLPANEKQRALKYKEDYELRIERGEYYE